MTGLLDIAPATGAKVTIRGVELEVNGLSLGDIAALIGRFPKLVEVFSRQDDAVATIMRSGPDIIAAVIAAGCGMTSDAKAEERAASLSLEEQFDILVEVLRLTMPAGPRPFVEKLQKLGWIQLQPQDGSDMSSKGSSDSPEQRKR
jgi:hypothetical protein